MLTNLSIRNIVLIEALDIDFKAGLTVLTGETGAGKSILLDSLGLILGSKAETRLIRQGCDEASVIACFDYPNPENPAYALLEENGIEHDTQLIIRRHLSADGKNKIFINDRPSTYRFLKKIGSFLCDIHGQFDTHKLLNEKSHIHLLDQFADTREIKEKVKQAFNNFDSIRRHIRQIDADAIEAKKQEDYLRFVLNELEEANPQENEGDLLETKRQSLKNKGQLFEAMHLIQNALAGEQGADEKISDALKAMNKLETVGGGLESLGLSQMADKLMSLQTEMGDILFEFQRRMSDQEGGDDDLEEIEVRLLHLKDLARKHQCQVNDLLEVKKNIEQKLNLIDNMDAERAKLVKALAEAKKAFIKLARSLHDMRTQSGAIIDQSVMKELIPLKMERAVFHTHIEASDDEAHWSSNGFDLVYFSIATNPGSAPGPLNKIASGGEMSRFMLALKVVLAEADPTNCFIFDEVDSGIGGATADAVGQRLKSLSASKQVMVITHSPQVAAKGDQHLCVSKSTDAEQKTRTQIISLEGAERRDELARMLAGATMTDAAIEAANALLDDSAAIQTKKTA